jgi:hypothetical protein
VLKVQQAKSEHGVYMVKSKYNLLAHRRVNSFHAHSDQLWGELCIQHPRSPLCCLPARKEIQEKKFVLDASTAAQQTQEMKWDASTPKLARGNKCARNKEAKKTPKEKNRLASQGCIGAHPQPFRRYLSGKFHQA